MNKITFPFYALFALLMLVAVSCEKEKDDNDPVAEYKFESLETPYLICAGRNPGGIGFDFEYNGNMGGAFNIDDSTFSANLEYDLKIRTVKGEKSDGSLGGAPFVQLHEEAKAVNYSAVDTTCTGMAKFNALTSSGIKDYTLASDDASFNVSSVATGKTGAPLMGKLQNEYVKLVIGEAWKAATKSVKANDEPIWIVKTREGRLVKLIVTDFPADPAVYPTHEPSVTETGFIDITWDYLD
jgi:predicted Fe-Mo cluster-binding NifX family protein